MNILRKHDNPRASITEAELTQDERSELLAKPSVPLFTAGKLIGVGRNTIYKMAELDQVPTINVGSRKYVPTVWIRRALQLDAAA